MGRNFRGIAVAVAAVAALSLFAGCGGGGSRSLPSTQQGALGAKVGVTFTFTIGGSGTQSASQRNPKYLPTSTQSIIVEYVGDNPVATPAPGSAPPSNATVATTVNVTTSATNPPPAGSCFNNSGSFICTITLQLPVGVLDFYILAFDGQNGAGNQVAGNVTIVQVAQSGALTAPGTTTPVSIVLGATASSVALNPVSIVPNGLPNPSVTAPSYPATAPPFSYTNGTLTLGGVPANTTINTIVVTDTDTSGNTCLVYVKAGATSATPCPLASAASSVSLTNSSDSYAVLYNGHFVPGGTISITASGASSPLTANITPTIFSLGSVSFPGAHMGPIGSVLFDPMSSTLYAGTANPAAPLYGFTFGATGFSAPTVVNVASVNGAAVTALSGGLSCTGVAYGVNSMTIGPDNNIWIAEHDGLGCRIGVPQFVAVAVLHSPVVNPNGGPAIQPGPGVFAEYTIYSTPGNAGYYTSPLHSIVSLGGFIWVISKDGHLWRINPTTGVVSPNLATAYAPGTTPDPNTYGAHHVTDPTGATDISGPSGSTPAAFFSPMAAFGNSLYLVNGRFSSLDQLTLDTSALPSAGLCTPAGPPPCIATFGQTLAGSLANTSYGDGGYTDGTSLYALNTSGKIYKVTPPSTLATSASNFSSGYEGGIFITPDGWLWTLATNGVQALQGMTSTNSAVVPTAVTACNSYENLRRGSTAMAFLNDTLLFSPQVSRGSSGTSFAVLCGVVY